MVDYTDAGGAIRTRPADLPLLLQDLLGQIEGRRLNGASDTELAELESEYRRLRDQC